MMLDAHPQLAIPPETHFVPTSSTPARSCASRPSGSSTSSSTTPPALGRLRHRRGRVPASALRAIPRLNAVGRGARVLRDLRRAAGQAALGRQDARLRQAHAAHRPCAARGALRPRDPRRARRRAVAQPPHPAPRREEPAARPGRGDGAALAQADREVARRRAGASATTRDPLRGPRHRHRADAAADLRVHRARLRPGDARLPRGRRGAPPGDGPRPAGRPGPPPPPRRGAAPGTRAAQGAAEARAGRGLARGDERRRRRRVRGDRGRPARRARLRDRRRAAHDRCSAS